MPVPLVEILAKCVSLQHSELCPLILLAESPRALVTDPDRLRHILDDEELICDGQEECYLLVSDFVPEIYFRIDKRIADLVILRVACRNREVELMIDGASTFGGTRIDEWQRKKHERQLWIDPNNVKIRVDSFDTGSSWSIPPSTNEHKAEATRYIQHMQNTPMEGTWWEDWRAPLAALLGVAAGGVHLVTKMHLSAKGAYVAFRFGSTFVQAGAGALDFSASAAFVGPPILLGVGVAAAVYFVPWDSLLKLLGGFFASFWNWLSGLMNKIHSCFEEKNSKEKRSSRGRPIHYA